MAFFDFLSQPVGGYAQGPMPSGAAGVPQSDVTWQQLLGAATSQGAASRQGQAFTPLAPVGMPGQDFVQAPLQGPPLQNKSKTSGESDMKDIMEILEVAGFLFGA